MSCVPTGKIQLFNMADGYGPAKRGCPFRDFAEKEIVEKFYLQYGSPLLISLKS